ncbi:MAG: recombinase family protein [Stellaceae bacterium]
MTDGTTPPASMEAFSRISSAHCPRIAAGRMMMQMIGSFVEFERAMIGERTSAGIAATRAAGRSGGPSVNSPASTPFA